MAEGTEGAHVQSGVPIQVAATRLNLSVEAVRKRAKRGTLEAYKVGNGWYIVVPDELDGQATAMDAAGPPPAPLVPDSVLQAMIVMQQQMDILNRELHAKNKQLAEAATERSELRRLLGNSQQTVQLLTAGSPPAPVPTDEELPHRPGADDSGAAQAPSRVRWRWPWERRFE